MGFIRKPMGEGLVCDRIAGQKVKSVIGPPGPPMSLGKLRREKGARHRVLVGEGRVTFCQVAFGSKKVFMLLCAPTPSTSSSTSGSPWCSCTQS